jgi:sarcosine oxidase/L-pipecolate oxidase
MGTPPVKTDAIIIVGAGVFGLSTALHLAQRGYSKVTVFDAQPYEATKYDYLCGSDAASADLNKIIRSAYGEQTEYQDLSTEAIGSWKAWNVEISTGKCVPDGMKTTEKVFVNNGHLSLVDGEELPPFERATIRNMEQAGLGDTQLVTTDQRHAETMRTLGFGYAIDPFQRQSKGKGYLGVLDATGGIAVADKACRFALHKAKDLGVRFILQRESGRFVAFCYDEAGKVTGIQTNDGQKHFASKVVMACGGWTPSLLPELDGVCETTAGSVIMMKIPPSSQLFERFAPERFPSWSYKMRDGANGGLYGFPRDDKGFLKIGYRGTKYTNPKIQTDGRERSVPVTRYTDNEKISQLPKQAIQVFKSFIAEFLPELAEEGIDIELTRLCWYTDSFDNHYVIDYLPGQESVLVATGGSGHAFKYLPNIGNWIVDIMEEVGLDRQLVRNWRWRKVQPGQQAVNVLMEGSTGPRALQNVEMSTDDDLKLSNRARL